jgi:hypothetical protein
MHPKNDAAGDGASVAWTWPASAVITRDAIGGNRCKCSA